MLRRKSESPEPATTDPSSIPSPERPFVPGDMPVGVHFYFLREAVFYSYGLLQSLHLKEEQLVVGFGLEQIVIEGRGLHALYLELAAHRVTSVHEQGERYQALNNEPLFITRMVRRMPGG